MAVAEGLDMRSKCQGSLLGSLLGDCLGFPFEDMKATHTEVKQFFDTVCDPPKKGGSELIHTDDTAMALCIAESLLERKELNAGDLAKRFVEEYQRQPPWRGYGIHVRDVFIKLLESNYADPLEPAKEQFGGEGSFGNGGAMRVTPVALYYRGRGTRTLADMASAATVVTHTNPDGINGAILQCLAVEQALFLDPKQPIDASVFLEQLIDKMKDYEEGDYDSVMWNEDPRTFISRLRYAHHLLQTKRSEEITKQDVIHHLGCGIAAKDSVVTAILCFLRAQQGAIPGINTDNPLMRTIWYAVSLGGDTDTIACMAAAMSGAVLGYSREYFDKRVLRRCEGVQKALKLADGLYRRDVPAAAGDGKSSE